MVLRALFSILVLVAACGGGSGGDGGGGGGYDYGGTGAALYAEMCQVCHGEIGEGGLGPPLLDTARTLGELRAAIDARMPVSDPGRCTGECAESIAAFVKEGLTSQSLACDRVSPSPRRVRLLNRREYRNTVRDLFALGDTGPSCTSPLDCAYRQWCDDGLCRASACDEHTFVFDPQGASHQSVHMAGELNGWAGTVAGGGWALTYSSSSGLWSGRFPVTEGQHAYKLVLNESDWIADPRSPSTVPDGYGGVNSVLAVSCAGGAGVGSLGDPAAGIPAETRPEGFPFDNEADAAVVSAAHLDAYLRAGRRLAAEVTRDLEGLLGCAPSEACVGAFVDTFGLRAFRRPLTDPERARYLTLYRDAADPTDGVATVIEALLVSPGFLYRTEVGVAQGDGTYRLTGYEMAAALSYALWQTAPDASLLDAAARGELDTAAGVEAHARRLLDDPRSRPMVEEFVMQWLGAEHIASAHKSAVHFPAFTDSVRAAMDAETRRFASHVVFESSGRFDELLLADYTFVDAGLASIYGMSGVTGSALVKQPYADARRVGLLGHGSVLGVYAHSDQTSPIRRGLFVRRRLLCQELPPPPPEAGGVPDVDPDATTRERFAQHTADPVCASCHQYIDDLGFGFERFDAIGRWREVENALPIDASGNLNDVERLGSGTSAPYETLPQLAAIIAGSEAAPSCFSRQYYRFARGFRETLQNRCARLWVEERFRASGFDIRELIIAVVTAPDFMVRR